MGKLKNQDYTLLIVEDEKAIREMLRMSLEREKYQIIDCETAEEAKKILVEKKVHLLLLDWMLPKMSGVDFAQELRCDENFKRLPIMMLTAKAEEDDKLSGFKVGIDDYMSKPFSLREMLARIQSLLRRAYSGQDEIGNVLSLGGITIDCDSHLVYTEKKDEIHLGPTEFKLLLFLMSNPSRVYSRDQLLDNIWGIGVYVDERTVDVHIRRLRKALSEFDLSHLIRTVRGSGYSFNKPRN